jgi:hypothetical protein
MRLEVVTDRTADALLYDMVGVHERPPQMPRHMAPDRGLAAAGHADEGNQRRSVELTRYP